jgi:hypothetical protein
MFSREDTKHNTMGYALVFFYKLVLHAVKTMPWFKLNDKGFDYQKTPCTMKKNMSSFLSRDHQLAKRRECKILFFSLLFQLGLIVRSYFAISFLCSTFQKVQLWAV